MAALKDGHSAAGAAGYATGSGDTAEGAELGVGAVQLRRARLEFLYEEHNFRMYQSGQPTVFSGAYINHT